MDPFEPQEANRNAHPVPGLAPRLAMTGHATAALSMLLEWCHAKNAGKTLRTQTGSPRVLPRTTIRLARQYVYDHIDPATLDASVDYARRYYTYALDVAICWELESIALALSAPDKGTRSTARAWLPALYQLGLEDP